MLYTSLKLYVAINPVMSYTSQCYTQSCNRMSYPICDRLCENQPCLHLVVIRETLVELKLTAFARSRPLLFSRTGLSNLLNKIQFTFEVVPCLILGLFRRFFHRCASILAQGYKEVGGREVGRGG